MLPLTPVIVSAATRAFTIASSVAWTVARNSPVMLSLGSILSRAVSLLLNAPGFAVEKEERSHGDAFALLVARRPAEGAV